jgi:hypothetical protein
MVYKVHQYVYTAGVCEPVHVRKIHPIPGLHLSTLSQHRYSFVLWPGRPTRAMEDGEEMLLCIVLEWYIALKEGVTLLT